MFYVHQVISFAENLKDLDPAMVLLDWEKAYDRIHIPELVAVLQRFGVSDFYLARIRELYRDVKFVVQDKFGKSDLEPQKIRPPPGGPP